MLRTDLANATCPGMVWQHPEANNGYIEIVEGAGRDVITSLGGDVDDMIFLTVRSKDKPFIGKTDTGTIQSNVAEVVWFLEPAQLQPFASNVPPLTAYNLHRRIFLVMPNTSTTTGILTAGGGARTSDTHG